MTVGEGCKFTVFGFLASTRASSSSSALITGIKCGSNQHDIPDAMVKLAASRATQNDYKN
jgi:hypothetical protein